MRTKNAKRLWPVPATLGVMALAALLAFGLLATTGAQPAAAQEDPCYTVQPNDTGDTETCSVTGSDATVKFEGVAGLATNENTTTYLVYYPVSSGGDVTLYPIGTVYDEYDHDDNVNTPAITGHNLSDETVAPTSYKFERIEVTGAKQGATGVETQSTTLTVSGSSATEEVVYVYTGATTARNPVDITGDPDEGQTLPASPNVQLTVKFLGAPVETVPDDTLDSDFGTNGDQFDTDDDPDVASSLVAAPTTIAADDSAITFTTTIRDSNGDVLEGMIVYSVEYMAGTSLAAGRSDYTTQPTTYRHAPRADDDADPFVVTPDDNDDATPEASGRTIMVDGWTATGAVVVKVSATFTGDTGSITLEKTLKRPGPLDSVIVDATCYLPDTTADEAVATAAQIKACGRLDDATPDADPDDGPGAGLRPRSVFLAGQSFYIRADALDALGTSTGAMLDVTYPDTKTEEGATAFSGARTTTNPENDASDFQTVMVSTDEDTPPGRYQIKLSTSHGSGDDKIEREAVAEVVISGEPETYTITGSETIQLEAFSSEEYTVKATDAHGNPPNFGEGEDMVLVVIESDHAVRVTGLDANNMVSLDHETGEGMFTVYKPSGVEDGDVASIGIFVDDVLQDSVMVTFGAPAPEATVPGMPMNVMAMPDGYDTINVSWEAPSDTGHSAITGYMVERGYTGADDMMMWMTVAEMTTDLMYMDTGLMAETKYYYRVTAMNAIGSGMASDHMAEGASATTGVMPTPPMASGMLDAVMLTVGDDAVMVDASGAFSMTDEDEITGYTATSDDPMVATASADAMGMVTITPVSDGSATVSVTATDKDGESDAVTIAVTVAVAPVASYSISDPGRIEAGMTGTVTVTAMDANGNATDGGTVGISISGDTGMVDVFDLTGSQLELGSDGMGSFRIFAKADATSGSVTVTVIGAAGTDTASQMVYIGPEPAMDLGAPSINSVTTGTGMATVMLTPGANADAHYVWAAPDDGGAGMWSSQLAADATSATFTGLRSGSSYWFIAIAGVDANDDGMFNNADDWSDWSGWSGAHDIP